MLLLIGKILVETDSVRTAKTNTPIINVNSRKDENGVDDLFVLFSVLIVLTISTILTLESKLMVEITSVLATLSIAVSIILVFTQGRPIVLTIILPYIKRKIGRIQTDPSEFSSTFHLLMATFRNPTKYKELHKKERNQSINVIIVTDKSIFCGGFEGDEDLFEWKHKKKSIGTCTVCNESNKTGNTRNMISLSKKVYQPTQINVCEECKDDLMESLIEEEIYSEGEIIAREI